MNYLVLLKSILHNIGVVLVGLALAYGATIVDSLLDLSTFTSPLLSATGVLLVAVGFLTRVWATVHFYAHKMRVISLEPQNTLITSGPYRFSRNPLYLGGNVFIFYGAALLFGSPSALICATIRSGCDDGFKRKYPKYSGRWTNDRLDP